ncbi:MAG: methyltransferase domain-containing protein [Pyrinomonadaceae bacterium]|nr:methyltransferase domain-containing protein [Pyrinomonadaceae bacterium]
MIAKSGLVRRILLFLFSHRTLALLRWDLHFLSIRLNNLILQKDRRLLKNIADGERPAFLNLGSGPRGLKDGNWINVDGYADTNVQHLMDFARSWPFPDNCFDGIFCEHVFEHFDFEQGQKVLRESLRVLQPGRAIRIIVPDGEKILRSYCENASELSAHRETETGRAMEAVNSYFRQGYEHQFIYDSELLRHQLAAAGFDRITRVGFAKGNASSAIILDDARYEWESLYIEAVKPLPDGGTRG